VHLQADPTKLELLSKEVEKRKEDFKSSAKDSILDKYGFLQSRSGYLDLPF
jgi:pre-mRNA-processing factor SLU7